MVESVGRGAPAVVDKAIALRKREMETDRRECGGAGGNGYHQVWCVFDKDDVPDRAFLNAIELAGRNRIRVAYSNQAFELWFLLHFDYLDTGLSRDSYCTSLTVRLGSEYQKNDRGMYEKLLDRQQTAIRNAQRLFESYAEHHPERDDPCTTVYELVEELNKWVP